MRKDLTPPVAPQKPHVHRAHGHERPDPYFWLKDRDQPDVLAYLEAENSYRKEVMAPLAHLEDSLFKEIVGRIAPEDASVPYLDNGFWYTTRFSEGSEYPVYGRRADLPDAEESVMLDVNRLAEGHSYYHVGHRAVSPDNRYLAFGEDTLSRRIYKIRLMDLASGKLLEDEIPGTTGQVVWAADSLHFFYLFKDETLRPSRVFRHRLGDPVSRDVLVYEEKDEAFHCHLARSRSRSFIFIASEQTVSSEYRYLPADQPTGVFRVFLPRERHLEYQIDHFRDAFWIRTNWDAANFRLMRSTEPERGKEGWSEVIRHRDEILLERFLCFDRFLALEERHEGICRIAIHSWETGESHDMAFPEEAYVAGFDANPEASSPTIRVHYTSMTTPLSIVDYDPHTRQMAWKKQEPVLGGFDKNDYRSERLWVAASDGARIPVSLVYHKSVVRDGKAPLLLYGYGSYGISLDPYFSSSRLSLLDRGFVFAIAHIRGGEEMGRSWYEQGKLKNKINTFTDFISCAEALVANRYTSQDRLFAMGGSAGGLLVGAVMNMRPELWKGIIAAVPFVDVVTTMLDTSIPLTTGEFDEWGNPEDPGYYACMLAYSPYDNVGKKAYPALLVTTGLHDSQVQYWEPAKWVARLREMRTNDNPLLLYCNMDTGHGGASGRFVRHRETAMEYAFLLDLADEES
ncbi:MAG: S9 family peptidase [Saprospiraceae bacterium]|nr:S9 family peptidase [Saprospiraceae bacterium]